MKDDTKVDVLREVLDAFNRHDLDAIISHFAEDCVFESPRGPDAWGRRFVGKHEVRRGLAARFEGIPDVHYGDDDHFACGDRGVSEWTISGTTTDGEKIEVRGCDLWTLRRRREARSQGFLLEDSRRLTSKVERRPARCRVAQSSIVARARSSTRSSAARATARS